MKHIHTRPQPAANRIFPALCRSHGLPQPVAEHRFCPARRWRFDYAWPAAKLALEVEGGLWIAGRHNRPSGMLKDFEKYNRAAVLGWRILKCTPQQLLTADLVRSVGEALSEGRVA